MNLKKLFDIQKVLRDRINYNGPDRFEKLILALLVEIGELANEWRGFKYWSVNQTPHTSAVRVPTMMEEDKEYYNPLLEEYVDGLHFVLELGIELGYNRSSNENLIKEMSGEQLEDSINAQFRIVFYYVSTDFFDESDNYFKLLTAYIILGEMLGFTWTEIEQAYMLKNQVNHERQTNGY